MALADKRSRSRERPTNGSVGHSNTSSVSSWANARMSEVLQTSWSRRRRARTARRGAPSHAADLHGEWELELVLLTVLLVGDSNAFRTEHPDCARADADDDLYFPDVLTRALIPAGRRNHLGVSIRPGAIGRESDRGDRRRPETSTLPPEVAEPPSEQLQLAIGVDQLHVGDRDVCVAVMRAPSGRRTSGRRRLRSGGRS